MSLRGIAGIGSAVLAAVVVCALATTYGSLGQRASMQCIAQLRYPPAEVLVSRDSAHVAYRSYVEGVEGADEAKAPHEEVDGTRGRLMVQDGRRHAIYDMVRGAAFTPDGEHFVYVARRDSREAVVMDGKEFRWYAEIWGAEINPQTGQVAYAGRDGARGVLAIDGVEQEHPYDVYEPVWSPDGRRLAYRVTTAGKWAVVVDGTTGDLYDEVTVLSAATFSPDSTMYAYEAGSGDDWFYVVNGKPGPAYSYLGCSPRWGVRGHRLAYLAERDGEGVVVVDGHEQAGLPGHSLVLSPDGRRLAYVTGDWDRGRAVIDGTPGPLYRLISSAIFSPDGRHVAYTGYKTDSAGRALVVDGSEQSVDARWVTFSPDGKHLAYVEHGADGDALVVDGRTRDRHRGIGPLQFSPDSRHLAYVGHATPAPDSAYVPRPEPVGGHAVLEGRRSARLRVFVDGRAGPEFDGVCLRSSSFVANGVVRYVAVKGKAVYVVQQSVSERDWIDE